jgi:hypothetical protein
MAGIYGKRKVEEIFLGTTKGMEGITMIVSLVGT